MQIKIDGNSLTLDAFQSVADGIAKTVLSDSAKKKINFARKTLEELINTGQAFYGVNTGFGALANRKIEKRDLKKLQKNLIKSHTAGVGNMLPDNIVRGTMLLRANVLAKGFSGVRIQVVEFLLEMLNRDILPLIPSKGSVGASGDLAPLAHLAITLLGEGEVKYKGNVCPAKEALKKSGMKPLVLLEKEGLALINGTQVLTAIAALNLLESEHLVKIADIAGALTFEAQLGNPSPFFEDIQRVRPFPGQKTTASNIRKLIKNSKLWDSHKGKEKVQDAYSIRCIPQVHGAVRDTLSFVRNTVETEINSATENPMIFPEKKVILSGGNFHGAPVAFAMDYLSIAMTELGNISERRIDRVINPATNMNLPPFLIRDNGLNSGFMIAHVTATSLTSENRTLAHPASVDNIPTSANQEDHVSMGNFASRKAAEIIANVKYILAIEILCSLQALDFYEHTPGVALEKFKKRVREKVPFLSEDDRMDTLFEGVVEIINDRKFIKTLNLL